MQFDALLNNGAGFSPLTPIQVTTGYGEQQTVSVSAGDFTGDSRQDVAIATNAGSGVDSPGIFILLGNGDGTFQSPLLYGANMSGPIAIGDFNKDKKLDLIGDSPATSPGVSVLLGHGDGTFGLPVETATSASFAALVIADFNGDGKLDVAGIVATGGPSGQVVELLGNGDGTFSPGSTYDLGFVPTAIASGDFDGDGKVDLVVGGATIYAVSTVVVFLGNGDGTFQSPIITIAGSNISSIAVADFNLDGKADVIISNLLWGDVSLLLGNGDGTFQTSTQYAIYNHAVVEGPETLAVADFDGTEAPTSPWAPTAGFFCC